MWSAGIGLGIGRGSAASLEGAIAALGPVALYDFTDPTGLFVGRDGSGGNPVVGGTTSIGLALDRSAMGGLSAAAFIATQPERIANGGFDATLTGWTPVGTATVTSQSGRMRAVRTDTVFWPGAVQTIGGLVVGRDYLLTGTVVTLTGSARAALNVQALVANVRDTPGPISSVFRATATSHTIQALIFQGTGAVGDLIEFDDISVKEVPGNHAVAPADNQRPVLAASGGRLLARYDGVDDRLSSAAAPQGAAVYVALALATADTDGVLVGSDSTVRQLGGFASGSTADPTVGGGVPAYSVNGAPFSGNAGALRTALAAGPAVVEIAGADTSNAAWATLAMLWSATASSRTAGDLSGAVIMGTVPTDGDRALIRRWLAGLSGALNP